MQFTTFWEETVGGIPAVHTLDVFYDVDDWTRADGSSRAIIYGIRIDGKPCDHFWDAALNQAQREWLESRMVGESDHGRHLVVEKEST